MEKISIIAIGSLLCDIHQLTAEASVWDTLSSPALIVNTQSRNRVISLICEG
jgi:hypothetical protein